MITTVINIAGVKVGKKTLINRGEFAKILGVKPATLTNKICASPSLKSAIVDTNAGEMIWVERALSVKEK